MSQLRRPVMTDENKKLLTKYLGERWRDKTVEDVFEWQDNRTFTSRADMMDLYQAIVKKRKWDKFLWHIKWIILPNREEFVHSKDIDQWLFCLSGEGHEERCQMIAGWIKEGK
jgi:hypothetical protein